MYADTDLTIRRVAELCGVTPAGLSSHLGKHHRGLLLARYGIKADDSSLYKIKIKPRKGQSLATHIKYKDAIEAAGDIAYIEYNMSQLAHMFNLNPTALSAQLKVHYPGILPNRERVRRQLGIANNLHHGQRASSTEAYARALEMYRDTDMTIAEVAAGCGVSMSGFSQYMRFYHKDIIDGKAARRKAAQNSSGPRKPGRLAGNGRLYGPKAESQALYARALELYRDTPMTVSEITKATDVPAEGFKSYLNQWHRGEQLRRRGYDWDGESQPDLQGTRQFRKSTAAKYAPAIKSLKKKPRPVAEVAKEFGLNAEVFRKYLKTHEPGLAVEQGMTRITNGKLVKMTSAERYARAIYEYATTAEPLKSIARRHGIVYNSISGYVNRNCPEERAAHQRLVEQSTIR